MPIIQAGKLATYYQKIGTGPVLVLLHGWANNWEAWNHLIPALSERYCLIIPDLPGFGKTATPDNLGWTTADYADWLRSFLQETLGTTPFSLIGHSYGGKISVSYCSNAKHTPQPIQLVLIGSSGIMNDLSSSKKLISGATKAVPRFLKDLLPESLIKAFYKHIVGETDYAHANTFQKSVLRNILTEDFTEHMANINQPTLIIWGEHDTSSPTERATIFQERIKESTLKIIKETGHFPHHERPQEVISALKEFIHL